MSLALSLIIALWPSQSANPAAIPVPQRGFEVRHRSKVATLSKQKFNLLMIGDSITHNFEKDEYQPIWRQFYKPRRAMNLGYSGARTENIIWNLENGELNGQSPKVVTLLIGTNNADETNYPTHHTADQIADGVRAIVNVIRQKTPKTKILLLACFPFGEHPGANSRGLVLAEASKLYSRFADNKKVFYLDIGRVFLNPDGTANTGLMPDYLHPNVSGALLWAKSMEPLLCKLMGDESKDVPSGH